MPDINKSRGLFLTSLEMAEKIFSVPIEEREALLRQMAQDNKAEYIGHTDKSGPELATELIKKGVKAQSFGHAANNKKPLTITSSPDKLLETKKPPM